MAVRLGIADEAEVDRLVDELYAIAADPRTFVGNPRMVQVWGEKPPTAGRAVRPATAERVETSAPDR